MSAEKSARPRKLRKGTANRTPNIYDVAKEASVSVYTVSAVINHSARVSDTLQRRVEAAIHKLQYRPNLLARGLARRQTHTIGVIVPDIANPFFPLVVRGAEDTAQKGGYSILLCNSDNQEEKEETYIELLLSKQVDGILLTKAPGRFPPSLRRMLSKSDIPIVLIMRTIEGFKADAAVTDDLKGAYEAVSHLARIGYRRIGLVGGPLNVSNGATRFQGYRKALKEYGLTYDPKLTAEGDYRVESGYRAGLAILPRQPDAVFVANYLMTVGLMQAADEMGVECPEDFGLVSFDDYPWLRCFRPRLTTIDLPKYELGVAAAKRLLLRLTGKGGPYTVEKLAPRLRVRESCGFSMRKRRRVLPSPGRAL